MITIVCKECKTALRISGEVDEMVHLFGEKSEWYPDKFPCVTDGCTSKMEIMDSIAGDAFRALDVHDVTPTEAFSALNGLGVPEEQDCGPTAVKVAFQKPIKNVATRLVKGTNRSVIDSVEFEDGSKLFLGSSAFGAIVYRISKKRSFVEEVDGKG